jgi:hypothetical protein
MGGDEGRAEYARQRTLSTSCGNGGPCYASSGAMFGFSARGTGTAHGALQAVGLLVFDPITQWRLLDAEETKEVLIFEVQPEFVFAAVQVSPEVRQGKD